MRGERGRGDERGMWGYRCRPDMVGTPPEVALFERMLACFCKSMLTAGFVRACRRRRTHFAICI